MVAMSEPQSARDHWALALLYAELGTPEATEIYVLLCAPDNNRRIRDG